MLYVVLVVGALFCAVLAMRATRLLAAALWLAGVSALTAITLYLIGAQTMAVIELSLSVGLITILLVFAISTVGADAPDQPASRLTNWLLPSAMLLLVIGLTLPALPAHPDTPEPTFGNVFWEMRQSDVLAQIAMIFAGVLGVLGLLAELHKSSPGHEATGQPAEAEPDEAPDPVSSPYDEPERELEHI